MKQKYLQLCSNAQGLKEMYLQHLHLSLLWNCSWRREWSKDQLLQLTQNICHDLISVASHYTCGLKCSRNHGQITKKKKKLGNNFSSSERVQEVCVGE